MNLMQRLDPLQYTYVKSIQIDPQHAAQYGCRPH